MVVAQSPGCRCAAGAQDATHRCRACDQYSREHHEMIKRRRLWTSCVMSLIFFSLIVLRLGYLQIYCHAELSSRADRERARRETVAVSRGAILDRGGDMLAMSIEGGGCY